MEAFCLEFTYMRASKAYPESQNIYYGPSLNISAFCDQLSAFALALVGQSNMMLIMKIRQLTLTISRNLCRLAGGGRWLPQVPLHTRQRQFPP